MTGEAAVLSDVDQTIDELLGPMKALDARLAAHEENLKAELDDLRKERAKIRVVLKQFDPETIEAAEAKKKAKSNGGAQTGKPISADAIASVTDWLKKNRNRYPAGFTATDLDRDGSGYAQSTLSKVLMVLHEQGVIRLDRRGRGGAKIFQLTV